MSAPSGSLTAVDKSPERTRDVEVVASCAFFVVHLGFVGFALVEELAEDFGHIFLKSLH